MMLPSADLSPHIICTSLPGPWVGHHAPYDTHRTTMLRADVWQMFTVHGPPDGPGGQMLPPVCWLMVKYGSSNWYHKSFVPPGTPKDVAAKIRKEDSSNRTNVWWKR